MQGPDLRKAGRQTAARYLPETLVGAKIGHRARTWRRKKRRFHQAQVDEVDGVVTIEVGNRVRGEKHGLHLA